MVLRTIVSDDVGSAVERESTETGASVDAMAAATLSLIGTGEEVRRPLGRWRDELGISCVSLFDPNQDQIEFLAREVVAHSPAPHHPSPRHGLVRRRGQRPSSRASWRR